MQRSKTSKSTQRRSVARRRDAPATTTTRPSPRLGAGSTSRAASRQNLSSHSTSSNASRNRDGPEEDRLAPSPRRARPSQRPPRRPIKIRVQQPTELPAQQLHQSLPGWRTKSQLMEMANRHGGTVTQYRVLYHASQKSIRDQNSGGGVIRKGDLKVQSRFMSVGNKGGGNSFLFASWKLPGTLQRNNISIYQSTRPQLYHQPDNMQQQANETLHPILVIEGLKERDRLMVERFLREAPSGVTPAEFFQTRARLASERAGGGRVKGASPQPDSQRNVTRRRRPTTRTHSSSYKPPEQMEDSQFDREQQENSSQCQVATRTNSSPSQRHQEDSQPDDEQHEEIASVHDVFSFTGDDMNADVQDRTPEGLRRPTKHRRIAPSDDDNDMENCKPPNQGRTTEKSSALKRADCDALSPERPSKRRPRQKHYGGAQSRRRRKTKFAVQQDSNTTQVFGLIEGIVGPSSTSQDYIRDIFLNGQVEQLPTHGRMVEIPGQAKAGTWVGDVMDVTTGFFPLTTGLLRDRIRSLRNTRILLRHSSYSKLNPLEMPTRRGSQVSQTSLDGEKLTMSVLEPLLGRKQGLQSQGLLLDADSSSQHIGSVSLVVFEGFSSSSEAIAEAREVSSSFLEQCRNKAIQSATSNENHKRFLMDLLPIPALSQASHSERQETNPLCCGISFLCQIGLYEDYRLLLAQDEHGHTVAVDVVFQASNKHSGSSLSSCSSDRNSISSHPVRPLTEETLRRHTQDTAPATATSCDDRYLPASSPLAPLSVDSVRSEQVPPESIASVAFDQDEEDLVRATARERDPIACAGNDEISSFEKGEVQKDILQSVATTPKVQRTTDAPLAGNVVSTCQKAKAANTRIMPNLDFTDGQGLSLVTPTAELGRPGLSSVTSSVVAERKPGIFSQKLEMAADELDYEFDSDAAKFAAEQNSKTMDSAYSQGCVPRSRKALDSLSDTANEAFSNKRNSPSVEVSRSSGDTDAVNKSCRIDPQNAQIKAADRHSLVWSPQTTVETDLRSRAFLNGTGVTYPTNRSHDDLAIDVAQNSCFAGDATGGVGDQSVEGDLSTADQIVFDDEEEVVLDTSHSAGIQQAVFTDACTDSPVRRFPSIHDVFYGIHDEQEHVEFRLEELASIQVEKIEMNSSLQLIHEFLFGFDDDEEFGNTDGMGGRKIRAIRRFHFAQLVYFLIGLWVFSSLPLAGHHCLSTDLSLTTDSVSPACLGRLSSPSERHDILDR